jgi:hypothetical protein
VKFKTLSFAETARSLEATHPTLRRFLHRCLSLVTGEGVRAPEGLCLAAWSGGTDRHGSNSRPHLSSMSQRIEKF